jgi:hypothetical protein
MTAPLPSLPCAIIAKRTTIDDQQQKAGEMRPALRLETLHRIPKSSKTLAT